MPETIRPLDSFINPTTGLFRSGTYALDAQDLRDFAVSSYFPQAVAGGRLTLEAGVSVPTTDMVGVSTLRYTPHIHDRIGLFDGTSWIARPFVETSLVLSGMTTGKNYDIFGYESAGALALERGVAWTNDTTRAVALTRQNGARVLSGNLTRRYLGSLRATSATTTEDSMGGATSQVGGKRYLWNNDNQEPRVLAVTDAIDYFSYGDSTLWSQFNSAAGNRVEFLIGVAGRPIDVFHLGAVYLASNATLGAMVAPGIDSTSVPSGFIQPGYNSGTAGVYSPCNGVYQGPIGAGYHYIARLMKGTVGTCLFVGDNGGDGTLTGLYARIWA